MTIFTKPLTTAAGKLSNLAEYKTRAADLEQAREALEAFGRKDGLSTPFTDGGEIRAELTDSDLAGDFRLAEAHFNEARQDREALLRGAAVTAGTVASAAIGGLALREAHRRGWIAGALRQFNKRLVPGAITKQYGEIAGVAARIAIEGPASIVIEVNEELEEVARWSGRVRITGTGFIVKHRFGEGDEHGAEVLIPFDAVAQIDLLTNYRTEGNGKGSIATFTVTRHIDIDD